MAKLTVIICFNIFVSSIIAEPQCSPFHYHEQLLEKMIDVQHKMGIYSDKMEKWENAITDKLSTLDDSFKQKMDIHVGKIKMLESAVTDNLSKLDDKLEQQARLETKLTTSVNDTLADATEFTRNLRKELLDLPAAARTPVILFKARQSSSKSPSKGATIVFQEIVQNEGNGYNKDTGIFTAPVTGTYLFTVQICLYSSKELSVSIVANGKAITTANFGDINWSNICASTDGLAFIQSEEEVKVLVTYKYSGDVIYPDDKERYWSYFSGVLLH